VLSSQWSCRGPVLSKDEACLAAANVFDALVYQYTGALVGTNSAMRKVSSLLRASSYRSLPHASWVYLDLSGKVATYSAIYAAVYRSQLLPALTEDYIGLSRLADEPAAASGLASIEAFASFARRLAQQLRNLTGATASQPTFVSRLNTLLQEGAGLVGMTGTFPLEPPASVREGPQVSAAAEGSRGPLFAGYTATFGGVGSALPVVATLDLPALRCPRGNGRSGFQVGLTLGGPTTNGSTAPQVLVTATCTRGQAQYSTTPSLAPREQLRPGDHVTMAVVPGTSRSVERLADSTRHFHLSQVVTGVEVRTAEVGLAHLAPAVSVSVTPGPGSLPTATSPPGISLGSFPPLPDFSSFSLKGCTVGNRSLESFAPAWENELVGPQGEVQATAGAFTNGGFSLSEGGR